MTDAWVEIEKRYVNAFGSTDSIAFPELLCNAKFYQLLENALKRGTPITEAEMARHFPDAAWEEVLP